MKSDFTPYLVCKGNARAMMTFYQSVFGGELTISTFAEMGAVPSPELADKVMHSQLVLGGKALLMAGDSMDGTTTELTTICLSGTEAEELEGYWEKLSATGTVETPLEAQLWGDDYGMCRDEYGVGWMVNITRPESAALSS